MNAHAALTSVWHWHHMTPPWHLTCHLCCVCACLRACIQVIYWYLLYRVAMVLCSPAQVRIFMQWHHAMINLDRQTFLVSEGRTTSLNPFIYPFNCARLNWSWTLSSIFSYHLLSLFSCLTMLYHSLISWPWSAESQPLRSLMVSPRTAHARASCASRSSWACCSTCVHSSSWHNSFSSESQQKLHKSISSLNSKSSSHESPHPVWISWAPATFRLKADRTNVSWIRMSSA